MSQIRLDERPGSWTSGRVTLLGDAASCVSLLAGQGTALAMVAAYILAGELKHSNGDSSRACIRYQELFAPLVLKKQKAALRFGNAFAPQSKFVMSLRNQIMKLMAIPWIADRAIGSDLADNLTLPDYDSVR